MEAQDPRLNTQIREYRILELLGKGGMGAVYRARHEYLGKDRALKIIQPRLQQDKDFVDRFIREAKMLSELHHPNLIQLYEFGALEANTFFIVMELMIGQSVRDRIEASGKIPVADAIRIFHEAALGLSSAHQKGIIHRDISPDNLMLVQDAAGREVTKVIDFGLAKPLLEVETLTQSNVFLGKPQYASPEQCGFLEAGGTVDGRSDIYALAVTFYQMLTGKLPFHATTPQGFLVKHLKEKPVPISAHLPNGPFPESLERLILKCLSGDRNSRFSSMEDLIHELGRCEGASEASGLQTLSTPVVSSTIAAKQRRSVGVIGFKNLSGRSESAWLSVALSEMLTTELAAGGKLLTVSGETVARMKVELSLTDAESYSAETLSRIRRYLGADFVVLGSYLLLSNHLRIDFRIQDAFAGETTASLSDRAAESELFELVSRTGARLREELGAGKISSGEARAIQASIPANQAAARLYSEGLAALRGFNSLGARDLLEKAMEADPDFPLAYSALAEALSTLGYDQKALAAAKSAFDRSGNLGREERLLTEGRYREMEKEWDKAITIYTALAGFFPDNIEYGLRLAQSQKSGGKGKDALATIESLRLLPSPTNDDPRIDLLEAQAARSLSEFRRALDAALRAATKGASQGARLIIATAELECARACMQLGDMEKALDSTQKARLLFEAAGDRKGTANSIYSMGLIAVHQGNLDEAQRRHEQALAIAREIGDKQGTANFLMSQSFPLGMRGLMDEMKAVNEEAIVIYREIGDKQGIAGALHNIAGVYSTRGEWAKAWELYEQSLALHREIGNKSGIVYVLMNMGNELYNAGDLKKAKKCYEESLATAREIGKKSSITFALHLIARVIGYEGNLDAAMKLCEEASAISRAIGDKFLSARSTMFIGRLLLDQNRAVDASKCAENALAEFEQEAVPDDAAFSYILLSLSSLAEDRTDDAREQMDQALRLSESIQDRGDQIEITIAAQRVNAATGHSEEAISNLKATLEDATRGGLVGLALEAALALGQIELASGNPQGRKRLQDLESESRSRGYLLIASKAAGSLAKAKP